MKLSSLEIYENTLRREMEDVMDLPPHDPLDWHLKALCGNQTWAEDDPDKQQAIADTWFAEVELRKGAIRQTPGEAEAADTCWTCPVRRECLKFACDTLQEHGTWGGQPIRKIVEAKHDYETLVEEPNPFDTTDTDSQYYRPRLQRGRGRPRKINPNQAAA